MFLLPLLAVLVQALSGAPIDALQAPAGTKAIVFLFTSTDCPISNRYAPEVRRIAEAFGIEGRRVPAGLSESVRGCEGDPRAHGARTRTPARVDAVRDPKQALVKFAGATMTPEAAVVRRRARRLPRPDRRSLRRSRAGAAVRRPQRDLFDALTAIVAGKPVPHATTQAVGCFISDLVR